MLLVICFLLFFCGLVVLYLQNEHFLSCLIVLEILMVSFVSVFVILMSVNDNENVLYLVSFMVTFMVCHAAVGLGVLVGVVRFKGIGGVKSFSLMKF